MKFPSPFSAFKTIIIYQYASCRGKKHCDKLLHTNTLHYVWDSVHHQQIPHNLEKQGFVQNISAEAAAYQKDWGRTVENLVNK